MESRQASTACNVCSMDPEMPALSRDLNSTKGPCKFCAEATGNSSGHSIILISLPVCLVFIPTIFVSVAYIYAHAKEKMKLPKDRRVPYISDIGEGQPQSNLFTFGLTIGAFCTAAMVIVRYFQVKCSVDDMNPRINYVGLISGLLVAVGQVAVASFQLSGILSVHYFGAVIYSLSAVVFAPVQTYISSKEKTLCKKYRMVFLYLRGLLSVGVLLGFLIFGIFMLPPLVELNKLDFPISQSGEWCFVGCSMLYMLTFIVDFWRLQPKLAFERS